MRILQQSFCLLILAGLITCGILYIKSDYLSAPQQSGRLTLFLPNERMTGGMPAAFSSQSFLREISRKNIQPFYLTGDENANSITLAVVQDKMKRLRETNDTSSVIRVSYSDQATYRNLVWLIDQLQAGKQKRYALIENSLYIIGSPKAGS